MSPKATQTLYVGRDEAATLIKVLAPSGLWGRLVDRLQADRDMLVSPIGITLDREGAQGILTALAVYGGASTQDVQVRLQQMTRELARSPD